MIFISDENEIKLEDRTALYFYAQWMPFQKKMLKMIEKVENLYKVNKVKFFAIDADQFKSLCKRYSVESIPTVLIFKDNRQMDKIEGVVMNTPFRKKFSEIYK